MTWIKTIGSIGPAPQHHLGGKKASRRLLSMAEIKDGARVLVVGCGNGDTALDIASTCNCNVTATDVNPTNLTEAAKKVEKRKEQLKGAIDLLEDDLLNSNLAAQSFDRIVVESVLVMLPKERALIAMASMLVPGGILAINEALRLSGNAEAMHGVENAFAKVGIDWSLPSYDEWKRDIERAGLAIISDSSPIPVNLTLTGLASFFRCPLGNTAKLFKALGNSEARKFFRGAFHEMRKARVRWGYCLWLCHPRC